MLKISANLPCKGGIIAPPKIIIIKNAEPWAVYFPRPVRLKVNMHGHIIEQNKPPESKAYNAKLPEVKTPIIIPIIPRELNIFKVLIGLSLAKRNPPTCVAMQILKSKISKLVYFP